MLRKMIPKNVAVANKKRKIFSKEAYAQEVRERIVYEIKDGMRHVLPYEYVYYVFAKKRWIDRTVLDVFSDEFRKSVRKNPKKYFTEVIEKGMLTVNGEKIDLDTKVRMGDRLGHAVIRREPPVSGAEIQILHEDDHILVADKPTSIPVHPCGQFHFNTLLEILNIEHLKTKTRLYTVHRLDLVTSGVVVFAKSSKVSNEIGQEIRSHNVRKKYVARVRGMFPLKGENVKTLNTNCSKAKFEWQDDGHLRVSAGIQRISAIDGLYGCHDDGKDSVSIFRRLSVCDGKKASIVECEPVTGRTHQLRLHLQLLGFPIENDSMYGGHECKTSRSKVFSVTKGMEGRNDGEEVKEGVPTSIFLHSMEFTLGKQTYKSKLPSWVTSTKTTNRVSRSGFGDDDCDYDESKETE